MGPTTGQRAPRSSALPWDPLTEALLSPTKSGLTSCGWGLRLEKSPCTPSFLTVTLDLLSFACCRHLGQIASTRTWRLSVFDSISQIYRPCGGVCVRACAYSIYISLFTLGPCVCKHMQPRGYIYVFIQRGVCARAWVRRLYITLRGDSVAFE